MQYDDAGNRRFRIDEDTGEITTYTYDNANRLQTAEDNSGVTTFTYDANGNQLTIEEPGGDITTNTWDGENRLVQVEQPLANAARIKNSLSCLRRSRAIAAHPRRSEWRRWTERRGMAAAAFTGEGRSCDLGGLRPDQLLNLLPRQERINQRLDDSLVFIIERLQFLKLAQQVAIIERGLGGLIGRTFEQVIGRNAQRFSQSLECVCPDVAPDVQYSLHHRNYDPNTGRFTSGDPIEDDLNLYRYVSNNPITKDEPSGLEDGDSLQWVRDLAHYAKGYVTWAKSLPALRSANLDRQQKAYEERVAYRNKIEYEASRGRIDYDFITGHQWELFTDPNTKTNVFQRASRAVLLQSTGLTGDEAVLPLMKGFTELCGYEIVQPDNYFLNHPSRWIFETPIDTITSPFTYLGGAAAGRMGSLSGGMRTPKAVHFAPKEALSFTNVSTRASTRFGVNHLKTAKLRQKSAVPIWGKRSWPQPMMEQLSLSSTQLAITLILPVVTSWQFLRHCLGVQSKVLLRYSYYGLKVINRLPALQFTKACMP